MNDRSENLIRIYNRLAGFVIENSWRPGSFLRFIPSVFGMADEMSDWLEGYGYSVGPYLSSCFAQHNWAYRPKLKKLSTPKYHNYFKSNSAAAYGWWCDLMREDEANQPIAVSVGREITKKRLLDLGGPSFCRSHPESKGFNPLSDVCRSCAGSEECDRV